MSKYRHTSKNIKELEEEIKGLNKSLDYSHNLNEVLSNNYDELEKERINYRRIIKYHSLLLVLMNLLTSTSGDSDIDRIVKTNIQKYYRAMNKDLMEIPTNDNEIIENEFNDEERENDESEGTDIWDGEEEF